MCHMANIAYRVGRAAPVEELRGRIGHHEDAFNTLDSMVTQLEGKEIDLERQPFMVGPKLSYDVKAEQFTGSHAERANAFVRLPSREPFVVPEEV